MLIVMLAETIGLGLIIPTISLITQSDILDKYPLLLSFLTFVKKNLGINSMLESLSIQNQFLFISIVSLIFVYVFKNILLTFVSWNIAKFISKFQSYWPNKLFSIYLRQPYYFHVKNNSSFLLRNIGAVGTLINAIRSISTLILECLIFLGIIAFLIYFQPKISMLIISIFLIIFFLITITSKKLLNKMGKSEHFYNAKKFLHLNQGFGGLKEIKILGREKYFSDIHYKYNNQSAIINRNLEFINALPRYIIEIIVILFLTIPIIFTLVSLNSISSLILIIAVYSISLFRILPSLNKIVIEVQNLRFITPIINSLHLEFKLDNNLEKKEHEKIKFEKFVHLNDVNFKYEDAQNFALQNVEIKINKNEIIGIAGPTGAGKSTLVNVLNGLLKPTSGNVYVDGLDIQSNLSGWQKNIGYVPQSVFLTDDTVLNNIAFGVNDKEINIDSVNRSIKEAQLEETVQNFPNGLSTPVGERGAKLSGGEIQRIGIARALYNNPSVLIFDEFTSNLDLETEKKILKTILNFKNKKTIIIISHKLETIKICDKIFRIQKSLVSTN